MKMTSIIDTDEYFGGCPHCGKSNGYITLVRNGWPIHYGVCDAHRVRWTIGENLFSDNSANDPGVQAAILSYRLANPVYPLSHDDCEHYPALDDDFIF